MHSNMIICTIYYKMTQHFAEAGFLSSPDCSSKIISLCFVVTSWSPTVTSHTITLWEPFRARLLLLRSSNFLLSSSDIALKSIVLSLGEFRAPATEAPEIEPRGEVDTMEAPLIEERRTPTVSVAYPILLLPGVVITGSTVTPLGVVSEIRRLAAPGTWLGGAVSVTALDTTLTELVNIMG